MEIRVTYGFYNTGIDGYKWFSHSRRLYNQETIIYTKTLV